MKSQRWNINIIKYPAKMYERKGENVSWNENFDEWMGIYRGQIQP